MKWLQEKMTGKDKEKEFAKRTGGRKTFASGAFPMDKGDIDYKNVLVEHKFTQAKSFSLSLKVLHKIIKEGNDKGKEGILIVDFDGERFIVRRYTNE